MIGPAASLQTSTWNISYGLAERTGSMCGTPSHRHSQLKIWPHSPRRWILLLCAWQVLPACVVGDSYRRWPRLRVIEIRAKINNQEEEVVSWWKYTFLFVFLHKMHLPRGLLTISYIWIIMTMFFLIDDYILYSLLLCMHVWMSPRTCKQQPLCMHFFFFFCATLLPLICLPFPSYAQPERLERAKTAEQDVDVLQLMGMLTMEVIWLAVLVTLNYSS